MWLSKRGGDLWLASPETSQPVKLAGSATDPVIAARPAGQGPIVAAWETGRGRDTSLMALVLSE